MSTVKTGPANQPHRHKTKTGYWYDLTDVQSGQPHDHNVTVPDPAFPDLSQYVLRSDFDALVDRVVALENARSNQGAL